MKTNLTWPTLLLASLLFRGTSIAALPAPTSPSTLAPVAQEKAAVQYTLAIGRPAAAPAETTSDALFAASDAVAKARTQVEKELAFLTPGSSSPTKSLVIPRDASDSKGVADAEEDLAVMSHILDKAASLKEEKSARAMGISIHGAMNMAAVPRNMYLEGYGALFFLSVNYPLLPPPNKKENVQPKEETSTEWEDARRELFQPSSYSGDIPKIYEFDQNLGGFAFATGGQPEEYDADRVEELKKSLVTALKNAVHIRKLADSEIVTIVVNGRGANPEGKTAIRRSSNGHGSGSWTMSKSTSAETKGTKLIIRAKKTDIEAFQKDKTSFEDFRKQVTVMIY